MARSPRVIASLAKTSGSFAKYHYNEWRHPRFRYNILHLPDDILAEIADFTFTTEALEDSPLAPLPLSQVCRRFRSIVLGMSKLWKILSTDMGLQLNKEIMKRSRKQRLDVFCKCLGHSPDLFNLVRNHSARWESFTLVVGIDSRTPGISVLRQLRALDLANLETLCFAYRRPTHTGYKAIDNNVHCYSKLRAPKLTHLKLINIVPQPFLRARSGFALTKLTLVFASSWLMTANDGLDHAWHWSRLLRFLESTETLRELDLTLRVHELELAVLPPTSLPHITNLSLRVEDTAENIIDPFLRALRLPNLRSLAFALVYSKAGADEDEHDGDDDFALDPWTRETCAVNLYFAALFQPEEHFAQLTELALDMQVDPDLDFIKDNFRIPFHRMPMLERLHVQTNRNVFAPKPYQLDSIPADGLPLKELKLSDCDSMKNLTWIRTLSENTSHAHFERVIVEGELGCSRGAVESLERFFPREKIQLRKSALEPDDGEVRRTTEHL